MIFLLHLEVRLAHFLSFFEECKDVEEGLLGPGKARSHDGPNYGTETSVEIRFLGQSLEKMNFLFCTRLINLSSKVDL